MIKKKSSSHVPAALLSASCVKGSGGSCVKFSPTKYMINRISNRAQLFNNVPDDDNDDLE